ncbi:alpha/beta hydrolase family protein [Sphingomonas sp.]|uniref:alpha/beta hydrolase family protein n=1 Tax=Sphingomonas sp. TaxID=28214 RepID=UPI0035BC8238
MLRLLLPFAAAALIAADAPRLTWADLTARSRPIADATVSYGPDAYQKVDVWVPRGKGPFPTVVMVHGGCWQTKIADRTLMNWAAADLRADGIAVWNIDYRGVDRPGGGYPGTFADVAAAADRLAVEAKRFGFDTRRVVAVGHSAGGHLALWLAARRGLPLTSPLRTAHPLRIARVVSLGGLPDLADTAASPDNGCGTEVVAKLVGPTDDGARRDPYADTSVPRLLPLGVPQDLVNGREDRIIPYRMALAYVNMAAASGDRAALHTVPATGHVELIAPDTAAWAETKWAIRASWGPTSIK